MRIKGIMRLVSIGLVVSMFHLCWLASNGWAEMVPTESTVFTVQSSKHAPIPIDRQRLLDLLQREDIQKKLQGYGISQEEATIRINSLSDDEMREIADKVEQLSAGGHTSVLEDALSDVLLEIFLWVALIGFIALAYFVGFLVKSLACPFQEECDVLRPWWDPGDGVQGVSPVASPTAIPLEPANNGTTNIPSVECDPRVEACEWSIR